ncbi:hypothetical protein [Streptomyces himalayensis]|uniref:Uncharacterized protein n=1 Tax=Streptomyces himalayensis subsp. himalayensis TaxID=2756131 RepID=A0A7W0DLW0_9ACTN|nr:hypothetical protein [Streptomyces himalayensis]MBA2947513.1 hypothetical protein [Streptomyces himalayensis subsp. himalayensis]
MSRAQSARRLLVDRLGRAPFAAVSAALLERLAGQLGGRASTTTVYGELVMVTREGITVVPAAEPVPVRRPAGLFASGGRPGRPRSGG